MIMYGHEVTIETEWYNTNCDQIDVTSISVDGRTMIGDTNIATASDYNKIVDLIAKETIDALHQKYDPEIETRDEYEACDYRNLLNAEIHYVRNDILEFLD